MASAATDDGILLLVVTHNGAATVRDALESCIDSAAEVPLELLVIDNASRDETPAAVRAAGVGAPALRRLPRNLGVGAAYNLGLAQALRRGTRWLFLLDQDSVCGPGCMARVVAQASILRARGERVGAVSAAARSWFYPAVVHLPYLWTGKSFVPIAGHDPTHTGAVAAIDSSLTSGTLYSTEALAAVGGFREDYFIDFVDHECHLRLRRAGWSLWWDPQAALYHRLGKRQRMTADGLWIEHDPYRYYYMARNALEALSRLYGAGVAWHFLSHDVVRHLRLVWRHGSRRLMTSGFVARGVVDALRGRFGPLQTVP